MNRHLCRRSWQESPWDRWEQKRVVDGEWTSQRRPDGDDERDAMATPVQSIAKVSETLARPTVKMLDDAEVRGGGLTWIAKGMR